MSDENDILAAYGRPPDEIGRQMSIDLAKAQAEVARLTKEAESLRAERDALRAAAQRATDCEHQAVVEKLAAQAALREARARALEEAAQAVGPPERAPDSPEESIEFSARCWARDSIRARADAAATPPETGPGEGGKP